ncbi:hypothetical protein MN608_02410 [Microdochium nivale]|nr:hypothetical protein MN608_02410 [Microdochium nivale]
MVCLPRGIGHQCASCWICFLPATNATVCGTFSALRPDKHHKGEGRGRHLLLTLAYLRLGGQPRRAGLQRRDSGKLREINRQDRSMACLASLTGNTFFSLALSALISELVLALPTSPSSTYMATGLPPRW